MPLPEPTTRSAGKLSLLYNTGTINHSAGAHLIAGVEITGLAILRIEAEAMAVAAQHVLAQDVCQINGWRVSNADGATVYEESFAVPYNGLITGSAQRSDSASLGYVGKGQADTIGVKTGVTRTTFFPGIFMTNVMADAKLPTTGSDSLFGPFLTLLNGSTIVGADFYGQKASYRNYINTQVNAHYQKRYGL